MSREFVKIVGRFFTTKDLDIFVLNAEKREWKEGKENGGRVMDDLIKRQDVMELMDWYDHNYSEIESYLDIIREDIKSLPSAQKTGHWIDKSRCDQKNSECSECHTLFRVLIHDYPYCPVCGSKNRGEEE